MNTKRKWLLLGLYVLCSFSGLLWGQESSSNKITIYKYELKSLTDAYQTLKAESAQLIKELMLSWDSSTALKDKLQSLERALADSEMRIKALQTSLDASEASLAALRAELTALREQLTALAKSWTAYKNEAAKREMKARNEGLVIGAVAGAGVTAAAGWILWRLLGKR